MTEPTDDVSFSRTAKMYRENIRTVRDIPSNPGYKWGVGAVRDYPRRTPIVGISVGSPFCAPVETRVNPCSRILHADASLMASKERANNRCRPQSRLARFGSWPLRVDSTGISVAYWWSIYPRQGLPSPLSLSYGRDCERVTINLP